MAFFRFDHRGCGDSSGVLERDTSLEARCRDLLGAIGHLAQRPDVAGPFGLFGSSMGGAVCLAVAARAAVGPLVTFAAPVRSTPLLAAATAPQGPGRDATHGGSDRAAVRPRPGAAAAPQSPWSSTARPFRCIHLLHAREIYAAVG